MLKVLRVLHVLVLMVLLMPIASAQQKRSDGIVAGRVVDAASGKPVGGVIVVVSGASLLVVDPSTIRNLPTGDYRAAVAVDLDQGDWFDPDVLQTLLPGALSLTIAGAEANILDLVLR